MLFSDEDINKNNKVLIEQKAAVETGDVVNTSDNDRTVTEKESEVLSLIILNEYENETGQKEINRISELACTLQEIQNLQNSLPVDSEGTATAIAEETGEEIQVSTQHVLQLLQEQQNQHLQLVEALGNGQQNVLNIENENNREEQDKLSQLLNVSCSSSGDKEELAHNSSSPHIEHDGDTISLNIHSADAAWIALLDRFEYLANEDRIRGYVEGEKMFLKLWETFQTSTMSTFTVRSSDKFYEKGSEGDPNTIHGRIIKGRALWKRRPLIPYDGVPFVQIDRKYFGCRLGGAERCNRFKGQLKTTRNGQSSKVGCPAEADILETWRVPELSVDSIQSKSVRFKKELKKEHLSKVHDFILKNKFIRRYYVTFPLISRHSNHPILNEKAGQLKTVHPMIIEKIYELVSGSITEKNVIRCMLNEVVNEFKKHLGIDIQPYDRSFFPTDRDICNHIRNARNAIKNGATLKEVVDMHEKSDEEKENIETVEASIGEINKIEKEPFNTNSIQEESDFVIANQSGVEEIGCTEDENEHCSEDCIDEQYSEIVETNNFGVHYTTTDTSVIPIETNENSHCQSFIEQNNYFKMQNDLNEQHGETVNSKKRKWLVKSSSDDTYKTAKKEKIDLKTILKEEIHKSFLIISENLTHEHDEEKLRTIFKQVKSIEKNVQGEPEITAKREKRTGINSMVKRDSIIEFF